MACALFVLEIYIHHQWGVKNGPLEKDNYLNYCAVWSGSLDCIFPTAYLAYQCSNRYLGSDFHYSVTKEMNQGH